MPNKTEGKWPGEFLVSEANGRHSRDTVTLISGQNVAAGTVLGKILGLGAATAAQAAGNTGNGTFSAITVAAPALVGVYKAICTVAGATAKFELFDPTGILVGTVTTGSAFAGGGLGFTLTTGGSNAVVGDIFTITVAAGTDKYTAYAPAANDGSQNAIALAYGNTDASASGTNADTPIVVIARGAEVNGNEIGWGTANNTQIAAGIASLATKGILVRSAV